MIEKWEIMGNSGKKWDSVGLLGSLSDHKITYRAVPVANRSLLLASARFVIRWFPESQALPRSEVCLGEGQGYVVHWSRYTVTTLANIGDC